MRARDYERAVADKVYAANGVGVCGERPHDAGGADVPEVDCFVVGAGDEHVAFGAEGYAVDVVVVADERRGVGKSRGRVPESYALVVGPRGEDLGVEGPAYRAYTREVSFERVFEGPGVGVPDLDCAVGGCAGDVAAVGREFDAGYGFLVAAQDERGRIV